MRERLRQQAQQASTHWRIFDLGGPLPLNRKIACWGAGLQWRPQSVKRFSFTRPDSGMSCTAYYIQNAYLGLTYISAVPNTLLGAGNALFFTILGWSLLFLLLSAGGRFCCGTLYLQSGAALEIAAGAVLLASPDIADYPANTHHNRYRNEPELDRCFLYAQDAARITLRGPGAPGRHLVVQLEVWGTAD